MPGPNLHLLAALDALSALEQRTGPLFPVTDPACRNAFLCGAVGPDMGYSPGADPFLSDLAHYVRTGELARNLVRFARNPVESAFAWGWVHHILTDVLGHPLINHASAERLLGDGTLSVSYEEDRRMHVLVEVGLDASRAMGDDRARSLGLRSVWHAGNVSTLVRAYEETYGASFVSKSLLASHRASLRGVRWLLLLDRVTAARWAGRKRRLGEWCFDWLVLAPLRRSTGYLQPDSLLHALTTPLPPSARLEAAVAEMLPQLMSWFGELTATGLERLEDYNLDIGIVEGTPPGYGLTKQTLLHLARLRPRSPSQESGVRSQGSAEGGQGCSRSLF
jgi:hypothetical protein